jgi:hypothetical protein
VEAAGLNEDEMALIIKRFKTVLKGRKEYPNNNKTKGKRSCFTWEEGEEEELHEGEGRGASWERMGL